MPKQRPDSHQIPQRFPNGVATLGQYLERLRSEQALRPDAIERLTAALGSDASIVPSYYSLLISGKRSPAQFNIIKLEALRVVLRAALTEFEHAIGRPIPRGALLGPEDFNAADERQIVPVYANQLEWLRKEQPVRFTDAPVFEARSTTVGMRWLRLEGTYTDEHNANLSALLDGLGVTVFINEAAIPREADTWLAVSRATNEVALVTGNSAGKLRSVIKGARGTEWNKTFETAGVVLQIRYDFAP